MLRRTILALLLTGGLFAVLPQRRRAEYPNLQHAGGQYPGGVVSPDRNTYGYQWGHGFSNRDYERFYHYPYVYYPHNFYGNEYFRSRNDLYHRYPPEMQIPVYNRHWFNYYPQYRKYHKGSHFITDVF